jgi:hypothetical protein
MKIAISKIVGYSVFSRVGVLTEKPVWLKEALCTEAGQHPNTNTL